MGTIDTLLRIKADSRQAVAGLKPLQTSLEETARDAEATEKALNDLDGSHKISLNDQAIDNARREISRLRTEMRDQLTINANADTKAARLRIAELQRSVKLLDAEVVDIPVVVHDEQAQTKLTQMRTNAVGFASSAKGTAATIAGSLIGKWLLDGAQGAAEFETNMRAVNKVLGDTTQIEIQDWIEDNAKALNLSQQDASDLARSLTVVAKGFQDAGGDAGDFLINMEEITANVAAFNNAPTASVAEAIGAAFRGEFDSLQTYGVNLNAARVEQQAMKDGLIQAGQEMTPAIQTQATYNAILEESAAQMGSVGDNADTTAGKINNLKASVHDLSTELGSALGPALGGLASGLVFIADKLGFVIGKWNDLRDAVNERGNDDSVNGWDFLQFFTLSLPELPGKAKNIWDSGFGKLFDNADESKDKLDDFSDTVHHASTESDWFFGKVMDLVRAHAEAAAAADTHTVSVKRLAERVQQTADAYAEVLSNLTATNDAMIEARSSVYTYEGAIDDLAETLKENGSSFSPDTEEGRNNWFALVDVAEAASARVEQTFKNRGAAAANEVFNAQREALHEMLTDAGVDSQKAWALVNQVFKKPINMKIKLDAANLKRLDDEIAKLRRKRQRIIDEWNQTISGPISADAAERAGAKKDALLKPLNVQIKADVIEKRETEEELDGLTKDDRGKNRKAQVDVVVPQREIDAANAAIDGIIKLRRTAKIQLEIVPPNTPLLGGFTFGSGGGGTAPAPAPTTPAAPRGNKFSADIYVDGRLLGTAPGRLNTRPSGRRVA